MQSHIIQSYSWSALSDVHTINTLFSNVKHPSRTAIERKRDLINQHERNHPLTCFRTGVLVHTCTCKSLSFPSFSPFMVLSVRGEDVLCKWKHKISLRFFSWNLLFDCINRCGGLSVFDENVSHEGSENKFISTDLNILMVWKWFWKATKSL